MEIDKKIKFKWIWIIPSTFTSISSKRPPVWLIVNEFGWCTGPGPFRDTWGPFELLPLTETVTGQPGTDILLKDTEITWSQGSVGTNETANL